MTSPVGGLRSIVMSMSVCLSVSARIIRKRHDRTSPISVHVACGRGSVLRRRCNMLYTSGFDDDVTFSHNGPTAGCFCFSLVHISYRRTQIWNSVFPC